MIKSFFSNLKNKTIEISVAIGAILTTIIGILIYLLKRKQREVDSLNAKIALVNTQKQADLLESQIKEKLDNNKILDQERKQLNKSLDILEQKRQDLANNNQPASTPNEVEDYWSKK